PRAGVSGPRGCGDARRFDVPPVPTVGDLARWLTPDRDGTDTLEWLADRRNWLRGLPPGPLHHYWWRWDGARLIEAPKGRLRAIHRTILREVLDRVPPHPAAHGFVAGRSPLTFASGHVGQPVVVRVDLRQFFPSIGADRVQAVFRALGYPEGVAGTLAALCTSRVPAVVGARAPSLPDRWATLRRLASAHLPQGAPTSPSLANLVAWGLDVRLTALARAHGCSYSRYADDLAFSGAFATGTERFVAVVTRIVADEGFSVNPRKTRVRTRAARQVLAGVVVNARPTIARADVDALRALLHNCRVHGPGSQNRDGRPDWRAVLIGRVAWVRQVDPRRAGRLERDLAAIDWTA
ncbi:MAG: reverse transcriptase family protein, partial [Myxococcota bacterium]